jgi:hypothetical protein
VFNCLERDNPRPPILNDILLCTLATKVWELQGQYLKSLVSCINLMKNADTKAEGVRVHAALAEWSKGELGGDPDFGHLAQVGYILLTYRKCKGPWKWTNMSVRDVLAHKELYTDQMKRCYDVPNAIQSNLPALKVEECMKTITTAQVLSSHALEHYKAVYKRLLAEGKDLPDVQWLQRSLPAQQAKGQTPSSANVAPAGSTRRSSRSPSPSKGNRNPSQ